MNKEIIIATRDGDKFTFRREVAKEIMENIYTDDCGLIYFGNNRLILPKDNFGCYWVNEVE